MGDIVSESPGDFISVHPGDFVGIRSHRIKYAKVDADTGEEVANEDIVKGYKVDTDTFIEVTKEELENVALESTRTIEIDEFVDRVVPLLQERGVLRTEYEHPTLRGNLGLGDPDERTGAAPRVEVAS